MNHFGNYIFYGDDTNYKDSNNIYSSTQDRLVHVYADVLKSSEVSPDIGPINRPFTKQ